MKKELEDELFAIKPEWFDRNSRTSCMCFGFAVGDGWFQLLKSLLLCLKNQCENLERSRQWALDNPEKAAEYEYYKPFLDPNWTNPYNNFDVGQVKEKFAGLRFYYSGGDNYAAGAVSLAESLSYHICEGCGKPGSLRTDGWNKTECDECYNCG